MGLFSHAFVLYLKSFVVSVQPKQVRCILPLRYTPGFFPVHGHPVSSFFAEYFSLADICILGYFPQLY